MHNKKKNSLLMDDFERQVPVENDNKKIIDLLHDIFETMNEILKEIKEIKNAG